MKTFLLRHHARRAFGPLTKVTVTHGSVIVTDGAGDLVIGYPDATAAVGHMRAQRSWDTRPWWKRAGESIGGVLWLPTMVVAVRKWRAL